MIVRFDADPLGSLDLDSLAAGYRTGRLTPTGVVRGLLARQQAADDDRVWIHRLPADALLARAGELEGLTPAARAALPLFGVPFAIKDNIDLAGVPTTAACPAYAYVPGQSAPAVERLLAAGAIALGKTNLDQFATGLVGVRSPYGVPRNPFDPAYIPGGSSSGSAVAVASGLVSFALGTDTAGSGRVPAGFNNIVGLKPSRGLISTRGVVPACRSLDCVSILALTAEDSLAVLRVMQAFDEADPYSRHVGAAEVEAPPAPAAAFRFAVPQGAQREFFGDRAAEASFDEGLARLESLGGQAVEIDFTPFSAAANLLYGGPWVAERTAAVGAFIADNPGAALPVTEKIIASGAAITAVETFRAFYRMECYRRAAARIWDEVAVLAVPTSPTVYSVAELEAEPVACNSRLGIYTNFVNLFDLAGIAMPSGFRADGLPVGLTLLAPAFREARLVALAAAFHRATGLTLGATGAPLPPPGEGS